MNAKHLLHSIAPGVYSLLKEWNRERTIEKHKAMTPDEVKSELASMYRNRVGLELDLDNPRRYTEKIQWSKLNDHDTRRSVLSDKLAVRSWVEETIGNQYLIPLVGYWENVEDIEFDKLPKQYVLKTNNASGTNILVLDNSKLDIAKTKKQLARWMKLDYAYYCFEMQYSSIKPMIIAEQYMGSTPGETDLRDYKFLCFNGEPEYIWVDVNRSSNHARVVYDTHWAVQEWNQYNYPDEMTVPKPYCLDTMLDLAKRLSRGFGHVRVDLYEIDSHPFFGEMTFTNGGGFERIDPVDYDEMLGKLWVL